MSAEASIHVIDDDDGVRDSLAFLLACAGLEARTYESAVVFLNDPACTYAGCVVADVRMPEMSGIDLLREARRRGLAAKIIIITGHADVPLALEAIRGGAFDFIEKPFPDDLLIDSVRRALAPVADGADEDEGAAARRKIARLSEQERLVLVRMAGGALSKSIADDLQISGRALDVLRAKVMAKLEATAFPDLVRTAMLAGMMEA